MDLKKGKQPGKMDLKKGIKSTFHHIVPYDFSDVMGLSKRLFQSKHSAGRMAMLYSGLGLLASPLDWAFNFSERKKYQQASLPQEPIIFVIGAPRSGTTLTAQTLIKHLPIQYFNNLTSLFPYSPITALQNLSWLLAKDKRHVKTSSLYGRTVYLSEPNDALYFWDRWMDKNRKLIPASFSEKQKEKILQFFGAFEAHNQGPVLQKVNRMNAFAHLVAEILENARFVCLDRNPIFHAQSLLIARRFIHGDDSRSYGIQGDKPEDLLPTEDAIESVCKQVIFHKELIVKQQERIGKDRFIHLPYESFCEAPAFWVKEIGERFLQVDLDEKALQEKIGKMKLSASMKLDKEEFDRIIQTFKSLKQEGQQSSELIMESELNAM